MAWPSEAGALGVLRARGVRSLRARARSRLLPMPAVGRFAADFDALRVYGSGAASDGGAQADPDLNLGGFRSSTECQPYAVFGGMLGIVIERASGGMLTGEGILESDGTGRLRWTEPGSSTPGDWKFVGANAVTVLSGVEGLRVRRTGGIPPAGAKSIRILDQYNNAFGQDNASNAERAAGNTQYRAFFLKNEGIATLTARLYLQQLGASRVISATYASSGAIAIAPTGGVKDWPLSGFFENQDTGEVLYYASRTDSTLTVPAAGRDVFAEVGGGAAGSIGDVLYAIPGQRIAKESPVSGAVQTIAGETTAPTGLSFKHGVDTDDADVVSETLLPGQQVGVWTERRVVAGASARAQVALDVVVETQR